MTPETKDKLGRALVIAAMSVPPWNIFWWTVGALTYTLGGMKNRDASGDAALGWVLGAPVTLPMLPFMIWREHRDLRAYEKKQKAFKSAAQSIADGLRKEGIDVIEVEGGFDSALVTAKPAEAQIEAYRQVYADAVRTFAGTLTITEVCSGADPLLPLNREWAERHGFDAWAEDVSQGPCVDCGGAPPRIAAFGEMIAYTKKNFSPTCHQSIRLKNGSKRIVTGYICPSCLQTMGWSMMCRARPDETDES